MSVQQVPNKLISLSSQEIKLLLELVDKEEKVCRRSFLAIGRWTERLVQHVNLVMDLAEKLEDA